MIKKTAIHLLFFLISSGSFLYSAGTTAAPVLNFYPSPRIKSLGGSGTGITGNFNTYAVNPAVLGTLESNTVGALFYNAFMDAGLGYLGASKHAWGGSLSVEALGYFGGDITIDDTEGRHDGLHGKTLTAQRDLVFSAGYGAGLISPSIYGGLRLRYYTSTLLEEYSASTFAADAGYLFKTPLLGMGHPNILTRIYSPGIRAGASVMNMGPGISYTDADEDPLPLTVRGGISYPVRFDAEHSGLIAADVRYEPNQELTRGGVGVEYVNREMFFLRMGYRLNYEIKNFTWGLGVFYNRFRFDYAMGLTSAINSEHMFIFSMEF